MHAFNSRPFSWQVNRLKKQLSQAPGEVFRFSFDDEQIRRAVAEEQAGYRERLFPPLLTLWAFVCQTLSADRSCQQVVARVVAAYAAKDKPCSSHTSSYCKARRKLKESLMIRLVRQTGEQLLHKTRSGWKWHERQVKVVDGSTVSMPDTSANQAVFAQIPGQKPGLGFPIARIVVIFSLACGVVLDFAMGPYQGKGTAEDSLFRSIMTALAKGDILLADRFYCSYSLIAQLLVNKTDVVFRLHQKRSYDFRRGKHLGHDDHIVTWNKPEKRPPWLERANFEKLPQSLLLRELKVHVPIKGFRSQSLIIVTTLLDDKRYPKEDIAELYRQRWHAELDLRDLKQTLQMDVLRAKTPAMVRKELCAQLLAYNLIRAAMIKAAIKADAVPSHLSFKATLQSLSAFGDQLPNVVRNKRHRFYQDLLKAIASHRVGKRPNRIEPRAVKRRPKPYRKLTYPRHQARKFLCIA